MNNDYLEMKDDYLEMSRIIKDIDDHIDWLYEEIQHRFGKSSKEAKRMWTLHGTMTDVKDDCDTSIQNKFPRNIIKLPGTNISLNEVFYRTGENPGPNTKEIRKSLDEPKSKLRPFPKTFTMEGLAYLHEYIRLIDSLPEVNEKMFNNKNKNIQKLIRKSYEIQKILDL